MNQLIPTFTGKLAGINQSLVNARDLHTFLGITTRFNDWINRRIEEFGFSEGEDFYSVVSKTSGFFGGRPGTDFHITIDMAKELAMVESSPRGREARRYFIAMEKAGRELAAKADLLLAELMIARPKLADMLRYRALGLSAAEIGRLTGQTPSVAQKTLRRLADIGLIDMPRERKRGEGARRMLAARKQIPLALTSAGAL